MRGRREYVKNGGQDYEWKICRESWMKFVGTHELYIDSCEATMGPIYDLCTWETNVGFPFVCRAYHCLIKKLS